MSTYRWIPWTQPVLTGNTDYGETSASSINNSSAGNPASPWKASDGIKDGSSASWEASKDQYPAWWLWKLPAMLRVTKLVLYNKYSGYNYVTKNVSVYADKAQTQLIANGTFEAASFSTLTFEFDSPKVTNELCIVCEDSYKESNTYVGLGEVEIPPNKALNSSMFGISIGTECFSKKKPLISAVESRLLPTQCARAIPSPAGAPQRSISFRI